MFLEIYDAMICLLYFSGVYLYYISIFILWTVPLLWTVLQPRYLCMIYMVVFLFIDAQGLMGF